MHMYPFFSIFWYSVLMVLFYFSPSLSLSLSLSLSRIVYIWHPSAKLLRFKTLFVSRHLPLILLLFMFGSMMRRPVKTFRRTFPNVAFIRNAASFYQTFPILLYPLSFTIEDENLYVRYLVSCRTVIIQEFYSKSLKMC